MIEKYLKYCKVVKIDILVYRITKADADSVELPEIDFELQSTVKEGKPTRFFILDHGVFVHNSYLYQKRNVLRLLKRKGPVIGDCITGSNYRGKSIYPYVINKIAKNLLDTGTTEVFIIVDPDNANSIRGIEKAGYKLYARIKAKRFLLFYFDVEITHSLH